MPACDAMVLKPGQRNEVRHPHINAGLREQRRDLAAMAATGDAR
jgi:hypothetical protein